MTMRMTMMTYPRNLQREDINRVVEEIIDVMWPLGQEDNNWSPDTLDQIVDILVKYGLFPTSK